MVRVFPTKLIQEGNALEFCPQLSVELTLSEGHESGEIAPSGSGGNAGWLRPAAAAAPSNFFDYLLMTTASLLSSFQPLINQKLAGGLRVKTETLENILTSQPGRDGPEKVRNYIRFAYTNWGVRFVLLGGDIGTVPCRYAYVSANQPEFYSYIPCDLYYSCLDGSWNGDGDDRWGELTDGDDGGEVDLLGEVSVGRAPVDTPQEAATWVSKTVRYELDGTANAGDALFLATYLGFYAPGIHAQGGGLLDPLLPHFSRFTVD